MSGVSVFRYVEQLDAFVVTDEYRSLAEKLGIAEWHPAVWIGRVFALDNDYGEHWFDNWNEREARAAQATELGVNAEDLLIIAPERFSDGRDGPCHPPELRKRFWTDVLKSLELSYETLFDEARLQNAKAKELAPDQYVDDLEQRIGQIQTTIQQT